MRVFLTLLLVVSFFTLAQPLSAAADPKLGPPPAGIKEIEAVFTRFIQVAVGIGFVAMLVMLVMAGIKYLMSAGEPKQVNAAHQTVTWALMGIVFMALAWLILQLIAAFTGLDMLKTFNLGILNTK